MTVWRAQISDWGKQSNDCLGNIIIVLGITSNLEMIQTLHRLHAGTMLLYTRDLSICPQSLPLATFLSPFPRDI